MATSLAIPAMADEDSSSDVDWLVRVTRSLPAQAPVHLHREQSLAFINVNTRSDQQSLLGNTASPGDFSLWAARPWPVGVDGLDPLFADPMQLLLNPVRNAEEAASVYAGTRFDIYDSLVFQGVTDSLPGMRSTEATNRFNVRVDTKVLDWADGSHTRFTLQWRASNVMPSGSPPLAQSVGSPAGLNAQRTTFDTRLIRLMLTQGFCEDRLTFSLGKINPNDYLGLNLFASDETSQFLNTALDGNDVLPVGFQGYTEGAAFQALPVDWFYMNGVLSSASGTNGYGCDQAFRKGYFGGLEAGFILRPFDRPLRMSASWSASNANEATLDGGSSVFGNAWNGLAQWLATDELGVWLQVSAADASVAYTATSEGMAGFTLDNAFGRRGDGIGVGGGWTTPLSDTLRTQGLVEGFWRLQVTGSLQLTFDLQLLLPPGSPQLADAVLAGAIRAKFTF